MLNEKRMKAFFDNYDLFDPLLTPFCIAFILLRKFCKTHTIKIKLRQQVSNHLC